MKWIILNQITHLKNYLYHYLKQPENYFQLNYRTNEDFDFFNPDRAILVTNNYGKKEENFINDAKKNNVSLTIITENTELKDYNFLIREKEITIDKNLYNYNYSNMHLCLPKILNWIKRGKKGQYKFLNSEKHNVNKEKEDNYIKPSEGVDISEKIIDLNVPKKINIYMPTYYRFEKTKTCLLDIVKLAKLSLHDVKIYIGDNNTKIEEMLNWLKELDNNEEIVSVHFNDKNIGKAMIINYMDKEFAREDYDYFFSIDSDMHIEKEGVNVFDKMIEVLETCTNIGLVASNQSELSQHWYGTTVEVKENRGFNLGYTSNGIGISGGAICMRKSEWNIVGGYKENHDIYTGDDSILTYNVFRKLCKDCVIAHDYYLRHPKPSDNENDYQAWKKSSWERDNLNFVKDNYTGSNKKGFYD